MSRRSRLTLTLLASVLLHAAVFAVLLWGPAAPERRPASPSAVEMEIVYQAPQPVSPPAPKPEEQPPARASVQPPRRTPRQPPPAPVSPKAEEQSTSESASPPAAVAERTKDKATPESAGPRVEDAPREPPRLTLLPKNFPGGVPVAEEPSRGRTIRNLPGETPDPQALAEYQAEEAKARVEGWAADTLAEARAQRGAPSPYFHQLKSAFSEQLVNPPTPNAAVVGSRLVREQS